MKLTVTNDGDNPVRVIVDRDSNYFILERNETHSYDTPPDGVIEFRELGDELEDAQGDAEPA